MIKLFEMEDTVKSKHYSRRKRKSEKIAVRGTVKEDNTDRSVCRGPNQKCKSSHTRSPALTECDSPGTEVQNCSQFLEHDPSVVWDSPQASPNSGQEQNSKIIDLITPPQGKCCPPAKKSVISKPTRKLPVAASPSFLTKLLDLSEQYKYNEDLCIEEKQLEDDNFCDGEPAPHSTSTDYLNQNTVNGRGPGSSTLLVKDDFDMLLADDDDDVIIQCTQQVELKCKKDEVPNVSVSPHNVFMKSKLFQSHEIQVSSKNIANMTKLPEKLPSGKKNIKSEQSSLPNQRTIRTPGSARAKYYKDGQFLGYGSRKSPRTKKNIFETLNNQEFCDDSFESALQTLVDEDYSFLDTSVGDDKNRTTEISKKGNGKRHSVDDSYIEKTASVTTKTHQNELRNLSNVCCQASQQLKTINNEQTSTKSRVWNPKKNSLDDHSTLLSESGDTFFETTDLDDDIVNETELVNVLEIVESQAVPSSPPLRCTPEEIQRKRIEAKQKLAKKKLNAKTKTSIPSVVKPKR